MTEKRSRVQAKHQVNKIGLPVDPVLLELELSLSDLAAKLRVLAYWRIQEGQEEVIQKYHETMSHLYDLGWDTILAFDAHIWPMPEEYRKRNPWLFEGLDDE